MRRLSNSIVSMIFLLFLLVPFASFVHDIWEELLDDDPADFRDVAYYLTGEMSGAGVLEDFSVGGVLTGAFQQEIEEQTGNSVPLKAEALLASASLQRIAIATSNRLVGFGAFPSFYGSDICVVDEGDALMRMPAPKAAGNPESWFSAGLDSVAKQLPGITFAVAIADLSSYAEVNPTRSLVSSKGLSADDYARIVDDAIDGSNVLVFSDGSQTLDQYFDKYYTSDHHWSGYGAYDMYSKLAEVMGLEKDVALGADDNALSGLVMNGSSARTGLCLLDELVREPLLRTKGLSVRIGSEAPILLAGGRGVLDEDPLLTEFDFYHSWYGQSAPVVIENQDGEGTALLIGDSYTSAMQWLIAQNYRTTYVYLDCHGAYKGENTLKDRIAESECEAVYFVMGPTGFENLKSCYPEYFS